MRFLLQQCSRLGAEFVVWFFSMDYDAFWNRVKASGMDELFMIWKDTGMIDEAGNEREALRVWDRWFGLPRM